MSGRGGLVASVGWGRRRGRRPRTLGRKGRGSPGRRDAGGCRTGTVCSRVTVTGRGLGRRGNEDPALYVQVDAGPLGTRGTLYPQGRSPWGRWGRMDPMGTGARVMKRGSDDVHPDPDPPCNDFWEYTACLRCRTVADM